MGMDNDIEATFIMNNIYHHQGRGQIVKVRGAKKLWVVGPSFAKSLNYTLVKKKAGLLCYLALHLTMLMTTNHFIYIANVVQKLMLSLLISIQ